MGSNASRKEALDGVTSVISLAGAAGRPSWRATSALGALRRRREVPAFGQVSPDDFNELLGGINPEQLTRDLNLVQGVFRRRGLDRRTGVSTRPPRRDAD